MRDKIADLTRMQQGNALLHKPNKRLGTLEVNLSTQAMCALFKGGHEHKMMRDWLHHESLSSNHLPVTFFACVL